MSFCPICGNSFNISKAVDAAVLQKGGAVSIDNVIVQLLDKKVIESSVLSKLNLDELVANPTYKKLNGQDKEYIYNVISHQQEKKDVAANVGKKNEAFSAYFMCSKCGFQEPIKPKTLIFSNTFDNDQNIVIDDPSCMIYDNTLPRTKDYVCANKGCPTFKQPNTKEAVFFRHGKSYRLTYVCTVCMANWSASAVASS